MADHAFFAELVREHYNREVTQLRPLAESSNAERAVYRAVLPDGSSWIVRAYRRDTPVPDSLSGCGMHNTNEWLQSRAATLVWLAYHQHPAPRIIPTSASALVGESHDWCTLVTTFIEGTVAQPTLAQLRLLGAALGRLHALPLPDAGHQFNGTSWWFAELAIPSALAQLAAVEQIVPAKWQPLYAAFHATLYAIAQCANLPCSIIHGDSWAGNTIQTAADQVVQIDWEPSGLGPAVVDLGRLLLACHIDLDTPVPTTIQPNAQRIAAVMEGYHKQRRLNSTEQRMLLEAIRFSVAVGGACHLARLGERTDTLERRLARLWQRYEVSQAIAQIALQQPNKSVV